MRGKTLAAVLVLLFAISPLAGADAFNILFYGNSFTQGYLSNRSVDTLVHEIALAAGQDEPHIVSGAIGGYTLGQHLATNTGIIRSGIGRQQDWDYVVLQDYSTRPTHIGDLAAHRADYNALYEAVAARSPDVNAVGFETWARAPDHAFYTDDPPLFPGGPAQMQAELRAGYMLSTADVNALHGPGTSRIAPVGDAWENDNWDRLHAADLYHGGNRGTFLAALVIYSTIYQDDVSDLDLLQVGSTMWLSGPDVAELTAVADATTGIPEPATALLLLAAAGCLPRWR